MKRHTTIPAEINIILAQGCDPPTPPDLQLVEHAVGLQLCGHEGGPQHELAHARLHEELLQHRIHVAGGAPVPHPAEAARAAQGGQSQGIRPEGEREARWNPD